jgi:DNA repair photolyase
MNLRDVTCKTALSRSSLPGLDYSLNPYRGCQHGCIYCYSPEVLREKRKWGSFVDAKRNMPLVLDTIKEFSDREVGTTLTTINEEMSGIFEPLAPKPSERLEILSRFASKEIDTWVFIGPIIPAVTDEDLKEMVSEIAKAGVKRVITDKLRLRGGILGRIRDRLRIPDSKLLDRIESNLKEEYFEDIERRITDLCEENGIRWEAAFAKDGSNSRFR